jgi:hypothetical protein
MFSGNWKEKHESEIEMVDFKYCIYYAFMYYLYTGEIILPISEISELLKVAAYHCQTDLLKECETILTKELTIENVPYFRRNIFVGL